MGLRGTSDGELTFQDCRVHRANLLGAENGYLAVMPKFAGLAMVGTAGISLGIAQVAVNAAVEHAKTREIAGQSIGQYQGVQYLIAEMSTALAAARALTYSAAQQLDGSPPPIPFSSIHGQALCHRNGHRRDAEGSTGAWRHRIQPRVAVGALLSRCPGPYSTLHTVGDVKRYAGQNAHGDAPLLIGLRYTM